MNIIDDIKVWWLTWWRAHGTKFWGAFGTVFGIANEVLSYIQAADPKHAALWAVVIMIGVATLKRGFTNSRNAQAST